MTSQVQVQPLKPFPSDTDPSIAGILDTLRQIAQARQGDITQWKSLQSQFISGRLVAKVPSSSSDITGNKVGDFNVTTTFAYFCVNNAGTAQWVRVAVGTF